MRKLIVNLGTILLLNLPEQLGTMRPDSHACHFWRLRGASLEALCCDSNQMLEFHRCKTAVLSTANLKWNVSEVRHHCSSFGAPEDLDHKHMALIKHAH